MLDVVAHSDCSNEALLCYFKSCLGHLTSNLASFNRRANLSRYTLSYSEKKAILSEFSVLLDSAEVLHVEAQQLRYI